MAVRLPALTPSAFELVDGIGDVCGDGTGAACFADDCLGVDGGE